MMRLAAASRHYSRNLVNDVEGVGPLDAAMRLDIAPRRGHPPDLARQSSPTPSPAPPRTPPRTPPPPPPPTLRRYTRSSALFDRTERRLEERAARLEDGQLAIRDLSRIDGAMATLADLAGLPVTDFDTVGDAGPWNRVTHPPGILL